jgi:hypothetical protein
MQTVCCAALTPSAFPGTSPVLPDASVAAIGVRASAAGVLASAATVAVVWEVDSGSAGCLVSSAAMSVCAQGSDLARLLPSGSGETVSTSLVSVIRFPLVVHVESTSARAQL